MDTANWGLKPTAVNWMVGGLIMEPSLGAGSTAGAAERNKAATAAAVASARVQKLCDHIFYAATFGHLGSIERKQRRAEKSPSSLFGTPQTIDVLLRLFCISVICILQ